MDKRIILENLELLNSFPMCSVYRVANMLILGFGSLVQVQNFRGETVEDSQFRLHVQCPWRLVFNADIVLASGDVFEPNSQTEWTEDFNWDCFGMNLFDEKSEADFSDIAYQVKDISADALGGFDISFHSGHMLEVFPSDSVDEENWRLFETNSEYGFVVNGKSFYSYSDIDDECE
ncbi:MAG: hypothetical protein FWD93_05955 [Coriobacteriia bacterium]|nr:hypothetical protein [Coriobacteriia bacterium]